MKIHFTCSTAEYNIYREEYFRIRNFLITEGHLLVRDWLPLAEERIKNKQHDMADIKEIYKYNMSALKEADLVIVEDTVSNFSTGHQITVALQYHKPTLVLWRGEKHKQFKQMFIHGIDSDFLQVSEYTDVSVNGIITVFIEQYQGVAEKNRFHLVLSKLERQYLDWAQFSKNKSRTKIVREGLKLIIENDADYKDYLSKHPRDSK
jgi:hypothetical protein